MKRTIKFVSICLVITIMCASSALYSSATTVIDGDTVRNDERIFEKSEGLILDENVSVQEQLDIISKSNVLSDEQKNQAVDKINFSTQFKNVGEMKSSNESYRYTIPVPYFKQENSYFCGPATTKQSIHYINGISPSQYVIANALGTTTNGTDGADIVTYMNTNQQYVYYVDITPASEADMASRIYRGMSYYGSAPILRLKMTTGQGWSYNSPGHFMNASGIYSAEHSTTGVLQYEVTDPYIRYVDQSVFNGKYRINSIAVYNSTINHFAQKFYY